MPPPAPSARPTSMFGSSSLLSPHSATVQRSSSTTATPQHLQPPPASDSGMNRLSLDSALMRKNPFARANASSLSISTESQNSADVEPSLKSAPISEPNKRHSATFPLADRLLASFGSSVKEEEEPPAAPAGTGCEVSDDEMQALLEHVRRSENERARAENELQRREKELARVKNELRKAEREVDELRERLRHHEQHRGALDGTLKPEELGILPPASRHDSLDPNHPNASANGGAPSSSSPVVAAAAPCSSPVAGESPYYISGEVYGASTSTMDLSPTTAAAAAANASSASLNARPLSCSAAAPPPRFPAHNANSSTPRLQTQPSMTSISEAAPPSTSHTADYEHPHPGELVEPAEYCYYQQHQQESNADIAAAAAALEGAAVDPAPTTKRRLLRSRHGHHSKDKSTAGSPVAPRPKSSYAGGGSGGEKHLKEKKSAGRLKEKFSRMSLFGGKKDDGASPAPALPSPVPAPAMEA